VITVAQGRGNVAAFYSPSTTTVHILYGFPQEHATY